MHREVLHVKAFSPFLVLIYDSSALEWGLFLVVAKVAVIAHLPVMVIEGMITAFN